LTISVPAAARHGLTVRERRLLIAGCDATAVALAFVLAFNLHTAEARGVGFYVPRLGTLITLGLWIAAGTIADAWNIRATVSMRSTLPRVSAALGFTLIGLLVVFLVLPYRITRPTLILWTPIAAVLLLSERFLLQRLIAVSSPPNRIALVADRAALTKVWPEVRDHLHGLYQLSAVVDPSRRGCAKQLCELVESRAVSEVVIGLRDDIDRELFRGIIACHDAGVRVRSLADLYEEVTGRLLLDQLGHRWLLGLPMRGQTSHVYAAAKRALDLALASIAALVLALLILPLAPLIKLDGGPVFHRQVRVGKHGRPFTLLKLRTMKYQPQQPTSWTQDGDPRITAVGRVLRRLHLDELPQAWTILRGDMSLIGPRPEQPHYVESLRSEIDFYSTRLTVRPGLTGWAQVRARYGSSVEDARVKLSYDLYYVKHQSLALDLIILARTVMAVASASGR
jgi:exopolysaccharide biosynthesis polyprenyl glycosylphosphotransferase